MSFINEGVVETALLEQFGTLGYARVTDAVLGPDGSAPERVSYADVILQGRLGAAIAKLNPHLPAEAGGVRPLFSATGPFSATATRTMRAPIGCTASLKAMRRPRPWSGEAFRMA